MKYYSQAGQDRFVHRLIGDRGTFLEIGSNHPVDINNTYALEQLGWRGLLVDNDPVCVRLCEEMRVSPVLAGDATAIDWKHNLLDGRWATTTVPKEIIDFEQPSPDSILIDYLSLDVDQATLATLQRMPLDRIRFRVLTVEHDAYRFGPGPRDTMRKILSEAGYVLVAGNVKDQAMPFEDWWVAPELFNHTALVHFRPYPRDSFEWQSVIALLA